MEPDDLDALLAGAATTPIYYGGDASGTVKVWPTHLGPGPRFIVVDQGCVIWHLPIPAETVPVREHPLFGWTDGVDWFELPEPFIN